MDLKNIKKLYQKYKTPWHVQQHMKKVAQLAVHIAKSIRAQGGDIDVAYTRNLALLHDFMKVQMLQKKYTGVHDVVVAANIVKKEGELDLAKSIHTQQFDAIISRKHALKRIEEQVVYYADKRVAHTNVVSLRERLDEGYQRYGVKNTKSIRIQKIESKIFQLEKRLSKLAGENISKITLI